MAGPTRRQLLAGAAGVATLAGLGCAGTAAPPARRTPRPDSSAYEPGTLYPPKPAPKAPSRFATSPDWLTRSAAMYAPATASGGAVLLTFEGERSRLTDHLESFRDLPKMLEQGRRLGTDFVYITDYYQGRADLAKREWWRNKAVYEPREDLGGKRALTAGIRALHKEGGKVIAYVEPYIISKGSDLGKKHGEDWSIGWADGDSMGDQYPEAFKLCPAHKPWQDHVEEVVRRLVGTYGFDGVFLDSWGFQKDNRCHSRAHGHPPGKGEVFNEGAVRLAEIVRRAAQAESKEAVVLMEGPVLGRLYEQVDGSQDWGIHKLSQRGLWRLGGKTDVFTAGWSLDDMHQILAMGHKLSLSPFWSTQPLGDDPRDALSELGAKAPVRKSKKMRRYALERYYQVLHSWRNAAILSGVAVPNVDDATPRRWMRDKDFATERSYEALFAELTEQFEALGALGAIDAKAPQRHLKPLVRARVRLSPVLDADCEVKLLTTVDDHALAYAFRAGNKVAVTAVNTSNDAVDVALPAIPGGKSRTLEEATGSDTLTWNKQGATVRVDAHSVRMLGPA